jgi:hypothetical protein
MSGATSDVRDKSPGAVLMPARYVRVHLFETLTGYSAKAVERKIASGVWMEGREFKRAPDGHVLIDMRGYEQWVEKRLPAA